MKALYFLPLLIVGSLSVCGQADSSKRDSGRSPRFWILPGPLDSVDKLDPLSPVHLYGPGWPEFDMLGANIRRISIILRRDSIGLRKDSARLRVAGKP